MPSDTLVGALADIAAMPVLQPSKIRFRPLILHDRVGLAQLYLDSYPPGAAVADLDEALADVDATFAGDYGELWLAASLVAQSHDNLIGSIQVVRQSPWDPDLRCPFVIELFVGPDWRSAALGRRCSSSVRPSALEAVSPRLHSALLERTHRPTPCASIEPRACGLSRLVHPVPAGLSPCKAPHFGKSNDQNLWMSSAG